jgi:hypothetical protein
MMGRPERAALFFLRGEFLEKFVGELSISSAAMEKNGHKMHAEIENELRRGKVGELFGGADGIRTHGLLDAIEARSQLRHGPTVLKHYIGVRRCS